MANPGQMSHADARSLLARVGLGLQNVGDPGAFSPFHDPEAVESLGEALADLVGDWAPTLVCVWEAPEDMILGHVLARALGTRWIRCVNEDGLVLAQGVVPAQARVVIAVPSTITPEHLQAMRSVVELHGGRVVGLVMLVAREDAIVPDGLPLRFLAQTGGEPA